MILGTRIRRLQSLTLHLVPPVDFTCELCRSISRWGNEKAAVRAGEAALTEPPPSPERRTA